jgi:hypothetical protein
MPGPSDPSRGQRNGGAQGRVRGLNAGAASFQPGSAASRELNTRGRGRGAGASFSRPGIGRGGASKQSAGKQKQNGGNVNHGQTEALNSPFARLKDNNAEVQKANAGRGMSSQFGKPSTFVGASGGRGGFGEASISHTPFGSSVDRNRDPRRQQQKASKDNDSSSIAPVDDSQVISSYQDRYEKVHTLQALYALNFYLFLNIV